MDRERTPARRAYRRAYYAKNKALWEGRSRLRWQVIKNDPSAHEEWNEYQRAVDAKRRGPAPVRPERKPKAPRIRPKKSDLQNEQREAARKWRERY